MANPKKIGVWILAIVLAALFIPGGVPKLMGQQAMVERFADWGFSVSFLRLIGVLELLGGILVLIPRAAAYGGGLLVVIMAGAVHTHITSGIGSPLMAVVVLILAALLAWLRLKDAIGLRKE